MTTFARSPDLACSRARGCPLRDPRLEPVRRKVIEGRRLDAEEGLLLYETPDVWTVCSLADLVRRRTNGDVGWYNVNRHLNYSNLCVLKCKFCSFYRKPGAEDGYERSIDDIEREAAEAAAAGATEIHIVGGLHPKQRLDYYLDMMQAIRRVAPALHIKAFTAVEIVHFARKSKRGGAGYAGLVEVLRALRDAGLGSLPGGGAEVFDERLNKAAYAGKINAATWLDVHRAAHELGMNSNATILYGHIEDRAARIRHLQILREQQDRTLLAWAEGQGIAIQTHGTHEGDGAPAVVLTGPPERYPADRLPTPERSPTGYFQTIIPLPFIPDASELEHLPGPTGLENLRTLAVSRLMLDNFGHVKAFWIMQTLEMAQFMLQNGADDIDGTVVWYDITKVGGAGTHQETTVWHLQRAIREAGFRPVERDTLYRPVAR